MTSSTSILSLSLVYVSIVQIELRLPDGSYKLSLHRLDPVLGNSNGTFSLADQNFSKSARGVRLDGLNIRAQLANANGAWLEAALPFEIEIPAQYRDGVEVRLNGSNGEAAFAERINVPDFPDTEGDSWGLTCVGSRALLFRSTKNRSRAKVVHIDLNPYLGVTQGIFNLAGCSFLDNVRNISFSGTKLTADLPLDNGEWRTRSLDVKGYVEARLVLRDHIFALFDDGRRLPSIFDLPRPIEIAGLDPPVNPLYEPLNKDKNELRVCVIQPGEWWDPISCSLQTQDDSLSQPHQCLSYTWGDMSITQPILVNGHIYNASRNLFAAMLQLRRRNEGVPIWIDALCINQQDIPEKNWQVARMGEIYRNAESVIVWLGAGEFPENPNVPEDDPDSTFFPLQNFCQYLITTGQHPFNMPGIFTDDFSEPVKRWQYTPILRSLSALANASWWRRTWTFQEVILPKTIICLFGPLELPWEFLQSASFVAVKHNGLCKRCAGIDRLLHPYVEKALNNWALNISSVNANRIEYWDSVRGTYAGSEGAVDSWMTSLGLLSHCGFRQASDLRDKVYGAMAMTPRSENQFLPDYNLSVEQIYLDFTRHVMSSSKSLSIWGVIAYRNDRPDDEVCLPTWVVDWRYDVDDNSDDQHPRNTLLRFTLAPPLQIFPLEDHGQLLPVEGFKLDMVSSVTSSVWPTSVVGNLDTLKEPLKEWHTFVQDLGTEYYLLGGSMQEAFGRTIVNDHIVKLIGRYEDGSQTRRFESKDIPAWKSWSRALLEDQPQESKPEDDMDSFTETDLISIAVNHAACGRKLFATSEGYIGFGPLQMLPGDTLYTLKSGTMWHYILRPAPSYSYNTDERHVYTLIGQAYVHGMMDGETHSLLEDPVTIYVA